MPAIPETALKRFEQLKQLQTVAAATAMGLRGPVDFHLEEVQRESAAFAYSAKPYGGRVVVEGDKAIALTTIAKTAGTADRLVKTWTESRAELPELAGHAQQLQRAQDRLADARELHGAAADRAAALRTAVEQAREALRERGWREVR